MNLDPVKTLRIKHSLYEMKDKCKELLPSATVHCHESRPRGQCKDTLPKAVPWGQCKDTLPKEHIYTILHNRQIGEVVQTKWEMDTLFFFLQNLSVSDPLIKEKIFLKLSSKPIFFIFKPQIHHLLFNCCC